MVFFRWLSLDPSKHGEKSSGMQKKRQSFFRRCPQTSINVEKVYRFLLLKKALDPRYREIQIDVCLIRNFNE